MKVILTHSEDDLSRAGASLSGTISGHSRVVSRACQHVMRPQPRTAQGDGVGASSGGRQAGGGAACARLPRDPRHGVAVCPARDDVIQLVHALCWLWRYSDIGYCDCNNDNIIY